jgi:transitional endoplasmic reticulum ATPase
MTAPSVIFFDEIDAIVGKRSSEQSSDAVQERVLSTLLNEMDGIDLACSTSNVLVIGATNRPDLIDEALLRPGRFDRHICIPLPSQTGRQDILRLFLRGKEFEESLDFSELARRTEGFSGADLKGLVQEAGLLAMHDNSFKFCMDHFNKILNSPGRRRVNIKEEKEYR